MNSEGLVDLLPKATLHKKSAAIPNCFSDVVANTLKLKLRVSTLTSIATVSFHI